MESRISLLQDARSPEKRLAAFLAKFTPEIAERATTILAGMRARFPAALELVYDNYNALAIGFGPTEKPSEAIFSIAVYPKWVSLFFLQGARLNDPDELLKGSGSVAKHVVLADASALDSPALNRLMQHALENAKVPFDPAGTRRLIIKSICAKQRPRRPAEKGPIRNAPALKKKAKTAR